MSTARGRGRAWPAFIKVGSYLPYPVKLCLNGHESLDKGILSCRDPKRLQEVCDELGPADVQGFFDRWSAKLPWPLTTADREAKRKARALAAAASVRRR